MPSEAGPTLPPCRRIRRRAEFEQVLRNACLSNKWFSVHSRKNECGSSRLGIIASKKIAPKAVSRNFAKRLIKEVFRLNFPAGLGCDIVVRTRRRLDSEQSAEERAALLQLLQTIEERCDDF